ncbi:unnamed protein product [Alopecurus aequalis]
MAFASLLVAPLPPPPRAAGAWWRRGARATPRRFVLAASSRGVDPAPVTFDRLREQLFQLQAEADLTQSKGASNGEDSNGEIRVFSGNVDDGVDETDSLPKSVEKRSFEMKNVVSTNLASQSDKSSMDHDLTNSTKDLSAYDDFIEHIDSQLNSLECEIEQYINSQLVTDVDIQQSINGKWHKLPTVLKLITETRERIAKILDNTVNDTGSDGLR